jgi:hypothetical protein
VLYIRRIRIRKICVRKTRRRGAKKKRSSTPKKVKRESTPRAGLKSPAFHTGDSRLALKSIKPF